MPRLVTIACLVGFLIVSPSLVPGQDRTADVESLRKEIELLKREIDLLKRENALLKSENESLKNRGSAKAGAKTEEESETRVTVDGVEYVFQGTTRNGGALFATVLATSKRGDRPGPNGSMVIVDDEGEKYNGTPLKGFGLQPTLREGVPVKLIWKFGLNALGMQSPTPSVKLKQFPIVMIHKTVANSGDTIDFRNVPAVITKSKTK